MLKFLVQIFYQPLFSHTFPFSNFPLAILFPSKNLPHQKAQSKSDTPKNPPEPSVKAKGKKQKAPQPSFSGRQTGWSRGSWGGA
jgi:hypothetical protein